MPELEAGLYDDANEEYWRIRNAQLAREKSLRKVARSFFTGVGKELYEHLLYEVCGVGLSCLDVENPARMAARCAKQEVGNRLKQLVEEELKDEEEET